VLRIIRPAIPLNPPDWFSSVFDREDVRRFLAIDTRAVLRMNAGEIELLMPPGDYVRRGKPFLKQRKIESAKRSERNGSRHQIVR